MSKNKGGLPCHCPECKADNCDGSWIWGEQESIDDSRYQTAQCPKCKIFFEEVMQVVTWTKKENQS